MSTGRGCGNWSAAILRRSSAPEAELNPDWALSIAKSLRAPRFLLSYFEAMQRRLRRNYCWMYAILLLALDLEDLDAKAANRKRAGRKSWRIRGGYIADNAALGPIPGWPVITVVVVFYAVAISMARCAAGRTTAILPMAKRMSDRLARARSVQDELSPFTDPPFGRRNQPAVDIAHRM